jgi:hypothetical protein
MANATNNRPATNKPNKITTPPKGRPTPNRSGRRGGGRVFGSTFQWIATAGTLVVVFVVVYLLFFA